MEGGSNLVLMMLTQGGWGVPNQGKLADVILEHSPSKAPIFGTQLAAAKL